VNAARRSHVRNSWTRLVSIAIPPYSGFSRHQRALLRRPRQTTASGVKEQIIFPEIQSDQNRPNSWDGHHHFHVGRGRQAWTRAARSLQLSCSVNRVRHGQNQHASCARKAPPQGSEEIRRPARRAQRVDPRSEDRGGGARQRRQFQNCSSSRGRCGRRAGSATRCFHNRTFARRCTASLDWRAPKLARGRPIVGANFRACRRPAGEARTMSMTDPIGRSSDPHPQRAVRGQAHSGRGGIEAEACDSQGIEGRRLYRFVQTSRRPVRRARCPSNSSITTAGRSSIASQTHQPSGSPESIAARTNCRGYWGGPRRGGGFHAAGHHVGQAGARGRYPGGEVLFVVQ